MLECYILHASIYIDSPSDSINKISFLIQADLETDEVFAQMTLQPVSDVSIYTFIQHFPLSFLLPTNVANLLNLVSVARERPLSSTRYRHSK